MTNALLAPHAHSPLPPFDRITPADALPALEQVLADNRAALAALLSQDAAPAWSTLIEPLEDMGDKLSRAWGPTQHLFGVMSTKAWREAYNGGLPKITEYSLELAQSEPLYRAYLALRESPAHAALTPARKKVIGDALRDFKLSGIALPEAQKQRFKDISLRLSELQAKFEENLMDAIQAWSKQVSDASLLAGMLPEAREAAAAKAKAKNLDGFLLTLDFPSYDAVITYADNRELRRELYEAYATRASDRGPLAGQHDNSPLMAEILALRHEEAQLLGFHNFAELSLATKMAESPAEVETFLLDLARRARAAAQGELDELKDFSGLPDFQPWDAAYYAEKLREKKLGLSDEELKPYFPLPQVLSGMFELVSKLYGVRIEAAPGIPVWHADVTTYALLDERGERFGLFYLDPYARDDKRSGAWMDECV
ncbi:MAG TPA: M3 family metallopeptidase, partial [Nevskiaceae bacterium]|nr:M3 family metallopeptidase [Nevskiaceae bacterium]